MARFQFYRKVGKLLKEEERRATKKIFTSILTKAESSTVLWVCNFSLQVVSQQTTKIYPIYNHQRHHRHRIVQESIWISLLQKDLKHGFDMGIRYPHTKYLPEMNLTTIVAKHQSCKNHGNCAESMACQPVKETTKDLPCFAGLRDQECFARVTMEAP